ncbi:MAG: sugar ABC transporter permease [Chloroflexi bacterium]|nr:sugar ABC transporter permease [Chloroflexota bacterium]
MISRWIDRHEKHIFPLPAVIFIILMMVFPLGYTVWNSLTNWTLTSKAPTEFIGMTNYIELFTKDERFIQSVWRTFYFTGGSLIIQVTLGVASGILIDAKKYPGKRIVNSILLLPMMATPVAIAMVWLLILEPTTGVMNYLLKQVGLPISKWLSSTSTVIPSLILIDSWEWTPLITLITLAGLATLPTDPYESAIVDGANTFQTIWHITLPMLRPTIAIGALLRFIDCFKIFDIIYSTTGGGPGYSSETLNIYTYQNSFYYFKFGYASSMLVIFFAIVLGTVLFVTYTRKRLEV